MYEGQRSSYIGEDKGTGYNINVAWDTGYVAYEHDLEKNVVTDLGNAEYRYACDTLLFPVIEEF